ncbi:MAG: hypothetical protein H6740_04160 [Alphaproteobacteria bacterium]|nr:hypothetical protein [Alphaproteobacteria bacterium]
MRPFGEARLGIAAILAIQLLTSVAGVTLLGRMSPAVEQILMENVYSTEAVEEMLADLARGAPAESFDDALERARGNVTEAAERPLLDRVDADREAALAGDPEARARVVQALRELGDVNRGSMGTADLAAQRLGLAGAWAMALLGFVGFVVSLLVYRRVQSRLLWPMREIAAVLEAVSAGDAHRRCAGGETEPQLARTLSHLNRVLDQRGASPRSDEDPRLRAALLALLDRVQDRPAILGGVDGQVLATNAQALRALRGERGPRQLLAEALGGELGEGWEIERLNEELWLLLGAR